MDRGHGHHHADQRPIDVVLITALATLSAFIYNMAASLPGGIEVTLAEDERWAGVGRPAS